MIRRLFSLLLLILALSTQLLVAQMFSVRSDDTDNNNSGNFEYSMLYLSIYNADLNFTGVGNVPSFIPLDFQGNILNIGFENEYTLIELGLGSNITGLTNNSEYFAIHFKNMRPLLRFGSKSTTLQIPIGIAFDYTRASDTRSALSANNLNQSGLMAGTGLRFNAETNFLYFSLGAEYFYGISFADGSAFRGNTNRINIPLRLSLKDLIGNKDLIFGATYLFKSINVTNDPNERFDYDISGLQAIIGINF